MEQPIGHIRRGKEIHVHPMHPMVSSWAFPEDEEAQATLVNATATIAAKNGMDSNNLQHIFPAVLRMLKDDSAWSK